MRKYTIKKGTYTVYDDLSECPDDIIIKDDWRVADLGDWVLADDGCVIEIIRQGWLKYRGRDDRYIGTCTGTFICKPNMKMDTEKRKNIYSLGGDKNNLDSIQDRVKPTLQEVIFARYIAHGKTPEEAYLKAFRTKNSNYAKTRAAILIKQERIVMAVKEELDAVFKTLKLDLVYLIGKVKDEVENSDRASDRLKALQMLWDAADVVPKQTKVTQLTGVVFQGFDQEALDSAERPLLEE